MPPFGIFRSEFEIVAGGFAASRNTRPPCLVVLVTRGLPRPVAGRQPDAAHPPASRPAAARRAERLDGGAGRGRLSRWSCSACTRPATCPSCWPGPSPRSGGGMTRGRAMARPRTASRRPGRGGLAGCWDRCQPARSPGTRFAGLIGTQRAAMARCFCPRTWPGRRDRHDTRRCCPRRRARYPAVTPRVGAAFWYEREVHDLFGVVPEGHPRLEPLILPLAAAVRRGRRPGRPVRRSAGMEPDEHSLPRHVTGQRNVHDPARPGPLRA